MSTFFNVIWAKEVSLIVNLTPLVEKGRKKADQYWPDETNQERLFDDSIKVTFLKKESENLSPSMSLLGHLWTFQITKLTANETRLVYMLHIDTWPDHGILHPLQLIDLCRFIDQQQQREVTNNSSSILYHCSAGIGRTGTLIAADMMWQAANRGEFEEKMTAIYPDLPFQILLHLRTCRPGMIQTAPQLSSLYQFHNMLLMTQVK